MAKLLSSGFLRQIRDKCRKVRKLLKFLKQNCVIIENLIYCCVQLIRCYFDGNMYLYILACYNTINLPIICMSSPNYEVRCKMEKVNSTEINRII